MDPKPRARLILQNPAVRPLFHSLKLGLVNSNAQVSGQTLTTTHGALRRLDIQDPSLLKTALPTILPYLIDKLGDPIEKVPQLSRDCIAIAWRSAPTEVEGAIKQLAFSHKVARVRENASRWTARMALDKSTRLSFRSFTSYLITALEDADGGVREASKQTIVELFLTVPPHARADLRREMSMQNVRKSMIQQILSQLDVSDGPEINLARSTNSISEEPLARSSKRIITPSSHAEGSVAGSMASTYVGSLPGTDLEAIDPIMIHSSRDLEHEMTGMLPCFEGRESEKNWLNREKNLNRLRGILRGNASRDHHTTLIAGIKLLLEGIIKGMTSLRTSLCLIGLQFAKDMFIVLGPGADQFVEQLMATLVKLTGATKKIQGQAANVTINVLLVSVSYHSRLLQHLSLAVQDKNVTPRLFATSWLKLLLEAHGESKSQIEHSGIEQLDKSIRKGLADANPGVRDGMRTTYWSYAAIWPEKAISIMNSLDATAKKQLDKANPSASSGTTIAVPNAGEARPTLHTRTTSSTRPPIKTLVQIERARATQPTSDSNSLSKQIANGPNTDAKAESKPVGLSSGPQRQGLGGAVRPTAPQVRKAPAAKSEDTLRSSTRSISSNTAAQPTNSSPLRSETLPSPRRRRPITEQLESENWRVRVEGVITLACLLANREPPNTDGQKITLPSHETLAPLLRKLMADSQAEVVDHLMAPEVIAEIAKIIEWDSILPRVLLMSETDDSETGHDVKVDCLPAVKAMFDDNSAVYQCLDTLALLKVAGHLGKPVKPNFRFTTAQKRPIIKAVLLWLTELIERHQASVDTGDPGTPAFSENSEYKLIMNRTTSMMTNIQPSSINYAPLATFLKALRKSDEATFDKNLSTFEKPVIIALKKAWGERPTEEDETIHEPVADVESVLGSVPIIVPSENRDASAPQQTISSPLRSASQPSTPQDTPPRDVSIYDSVSPMNGNDEDMTMIPPQALFEPKTPAGFRQALHMVDSPWTPNASPVATTGKASTRGKENNSESPSKEVSQTHRTIDVLRDSPSRENKKFSGPDVWFRRQMRDQISHTPLPRAFEEKKDMLDSFIERLGEVTLDSVGFKKLIKLAKEHPTVSLTSDDSSSDRMDIWDAGNRFDRMMHALMQYLADDVPANGTGFKVQAIVLLRTALRGQPQYFAGHECKAIETILHLRSSIDSRSLSSGLDELLPELIGAVDCKTAIITVLHCLQSYVVEDKASWKSDHLPSLQMAITALSISVGQLSLTELEGFARALAQLVVKTLNDEYEAPDVDIAEVRRSTVNLCMAMYAVIGDTRIVLSLLRDLKPSQQNLLTYYFANREQSHV